MLVALHEEQTNALCEPSVTGMVNQQIVLQNENLALRQLPSAASTPSGLTSFGLTCGAGRH